jgi:hypothetical protein
LKSDLTYVNTQLPLKANVTDLALKADLTYVNTKIGEINTSKANIGANTFTGSQTIDLGTSSTGTGASLNLVGGGGYGSNVSINFDTFSNRTGGVASSIKAIDDLYSNSLNFYTSPSSTDGSTTQQLALTVRQNGDVEIPRGNLIVKGTTLDINLNSELLYTSSATITNDLKQNVLITLYSNTAANKDIYLPTNPKSGQIINFYNWIFPGSGNITIRAQGSYGFFGYGMLNASSITLNTQGTLSIQYSDFVSFASNKWIVLSKY